MRVNTIDICRGLLFLLMTNTHALTLSQVGVDHWLRSDAWLPNGWGTVAFVVLSGYGVGFLLAGRSPLVDRDRALRRRAIEILVVMFVSNFAFAILRQVASSDLAVLQGIDWWLGFITLDSEWTISGVLMPTAVLLIFAPWVIRLINAYFWLSLLGMVSAKITLAVFLLVGLSVGDADSWFARFFLISGFGGFPVLPFFINGCLGVWVGMAHRRLPDLWGGLIAVLVLLQVGIYVASFYPGVLVLAIFRDTFGAVGKFGCVFFLVTLAAKYFPVGLSGVVEVIGRFALGSFVMHRVFLQSISIFFAFAGLSHFGVEVYYVVLFAGALTLTWLMCEFRARSVRVNNLFKRMYL